MKKQIHILEGLMILLIILISVMLGIKFLYKINHEKIDTTYMWNIKFNNVKIKEGSQKGELKIDEDVISLNLIFNAEGEFYEFTFDVDNSGSLDAELNDFSLLITGDKKIINSKLTYIDGRELKEGDKILSGKKETIKVRLEYPKQENKIYQELKIKTNLNLNYHAIH